jgi:squalene-hopene/tetraprenyl-beta-curcumene cyclase
VEETAIALDALLEPKAWPNGDAQVVCASVSVRKGLAWLLDAVDSGSFMDASPIGFYFAKLWYFEKLYPLIFTVSALRKAVAVAERQ